MKVKRYSQLLILVLLVALSVWKIVGISGEKQDKSYNISVIIRGKMDESWGNLKKGAENAADDLNVNLRFVAAIDGETAEEQEELLRKEARGTDAILISPVDHTLLEESIRGLSGRTLPIVLIESGLASKNSLPIICCDNEAMGKELAESVINHGSRKKKILILSGTTVCSSIVDRQKGFMEAMKDTETKCTIWNNGSFAVDDILDKLQKEKPDMAVALDTSILENLVKAGNEYEKGYKKDNFRKELQIYGVGCSSEILKDLENQDIVTLVAQDDFSIGYLGVQEAVAAIEGEKPRSNQKIRYILTNSNHMYDDKSQSLLFPFVK